MIKSILASLFILMTCITHAAIVQPDQLADSPVQLLDDTDTIPLRQHSPPSGEKKSATSDTSLSPTQQQITAHTLPTAQHKAPRNTKTIQYSNTPAYPLTLQSDVNQSDLNKLKSFAKKLENEYGDSELAQKSLTTLYQVKQLWNAANSQANSFATETLLSLELDKFIENDFKDFPTLLHSDKNTGLVNQSLNQSNKKNSVDDIAYFAMQRTQRVDSSQDLNELNRNVLAKFFRIETLYYLVALLTLLTVLQWAIKVALRFFP